MRVVHVKMSYRLCSLLIVVIRYSLIHSAAFTSKLCNRSYDPHMIYSDILQLTTVVAWRMIDILGQTLILGNPSMHQSMDVSDSTWHSNQLGAI